MSSEKELRRIRQDLQRERLRKNYSNRKVSDVGNKVIKWIFISAGVFLAIVAIFLAWLVF